MAFFDGGGKAVKFEAPGDSVRGTISGPYREAQVTKYGTTELDFWPDGSAKMQAIVTLATDQRNDPDDDGFRTLYVASTRQRRAITDALRKAGATDLEEGGVLEVTYTGDDPQSKNPKNPAKMYAATYTKPATTVGSLSPAAVPQPRPGGISPEQPNPTYGTPAPQGYQATTPAAQQYVTPAQPAFPGQVVPTAPSGLTAQQESQARNLIAMGTLDDAQISAALGLQPAQIAALRA